ncbi:hypothetical protein BJY52DRAFT_1293842 [Lactarius psammicola]|nr:hypothetical protein BJY52DRAFT_1293842 [Lactarius psammicola]
MQNPASRIRLSHNEVFQGSSAWMFVCHWIRAHWHGAARKLSPCHHQLGRPQTHGTPRPAGITSHLSPSRPCLCISLAPTHNFISLHVLYLAPADAVCICPSNPFLGSFTTCIYQPENCLQLNGDSPDIQPAIAFYVAACDGTPGGPVGFSTIVGSSSTTGLGASSIPSTILASPTTPTGGTSPTSTPASTPIVSSPPANAAASSPIHAHATAALIAGGIGALVAVVV